MNALLLAVEKGGDLQNVNGPTAAVYIALIAAGCFFAWLMLR